MIHYGKTPEGDLQIMVSPENVKEVYHTINSAGLLERRTFNGLKDYITKNFKEELQN